MFLLLCSLCVAVVVLLLLVVVAAFLVGYFAVTNATFSALYVGLYLSGLFFSFNKIFVNSQKKKNTVVS